MFYDLLNGDKESVALDFRSPAGRAALAALVERADLVIESSRPRALAQLGLGPDGTGIRPGQVWLSITGHGRDDTERDRVALATTAVAGGMVAWAGDVPFFARRSPTLRLACGRRSPGYRASPAAETAWSRSPCGRRRPLRPRHPHRRAPGGVGDRSPLSRQGVTQRAAPLGQDTERVGRS